MREWHEERARQIRRVPLAPGVELVLRGPIPAARQALLEAAARELAAAVLASDLAAPDRSSIVGSRARESSPLLTDVGGGRRGD